MPPAVAAILMSVSTIVVALNAQLLRRLDLRPGAIDATEPDTGGGVEATPSASGEVNSATR